MKKYNNTQPESVLLSIKPEQPAVAKELQKQGLLVKTGLKAGNPGAR
ncbi:MULTISPECIES: hypothetical protein [Pseudoalteromonas]|nr:MULTISPECIES: hypothetical protein [Pseudoalteromonas]